jgi:diguanylate cyclase (GGDEF)-like protein
MDDTGAAGDVRNRTSALIRERHITLAGDIAAVISTLSSNLSDDDWRGCAELLPALFASGVDAGALDPRSAAMRDLGRYSPRLTTRELFDAVHHAERVILDEVALDSELGATSEPWALVAHVTRRTTLEILRALADQMADRDVPVTVRDPLTTLIVGPVFDLALAQEIERAHRYKQPLAILLFDLDNLSRMNKEHGRSVGDRLLERTGILARQFFRTHDWVARRGGDGIAVLLPQATVDQAEGLARGFSDAVRQRLVMHDQDTGVSQIVTVSAAAVGTGQVTGELDATAVIATAEAAVARARESGRIERVLLPAG